MEEDLYAWGYGEHLPDFVMDTLMGQGITSVPQLLDLTHEDVVIFFEDPRLLTSSQCRALKAALTRLSESVGGPAVTARGLPTHADDTTDQDDVRYNDDGRFTGFQSSRTATHTPQKCLYSTRNDSDDTDDESEFEVTCSLAAAPIREDAPREYCGPHQTRAAPVHTWDDDCGDVGPDAENTVRLLLLGKTGSGKSTTGNTILGQQLFSTALDFGSVTSECERQVGVRGDTRIEIMDSPGLYDTHKTHEEICTIIVQAVAGMHPGPHAVLYVIGMGRFTSEEYSAYKRLKALFDNGITRHIILLFTHGDDLEREGVTLAELMLSEKTPENLKQVFSECGHRCLLFNNLAADPKPQVDKLFEEVRQLVARNDGRPYTCPKYSKIGEGLEQEVNKRMLKFEKRDLERQKYVQDLKKQTMEAKKAAERTRREFERKEQQRERQAREEEEQREKIERELIEQLVDHQDNLDTQRRELEQLKKQQARQEEKDRQRRQKEDRLSREEEKRLKREAEQLRQQERQMAERINEQEHHYRQKEEERQRLERERWRKQKEHEEQRRKDMEEVNRTNREQEERMKRQIQAEKEERDRKDRVRQREMENLKARVAKKEEPGFFGKVVNFIASPIKAFFGLFS